MSAQSSCLGCLEAGSHLQGIAGERETGKPTAPPATCLGRKHRCSGSFLEIAFGGSMQKVVDFSAASSPLVGLCMQSSMSNVSRQGSSLAGEGRSLLQDLGRCCTFKPR